MDHFGQARQAIFAHGFDDLRLIDYRDLPEKGLTFDRIVSVGMMEHVGRDNYQTYYECANALLRDGGLFLLHSITGNDEEMSDSFMRKYIFPGGFLPSVKLMERSVSAHTALRITDRYSFGPHYAHTLRLWLQRFTANSAGADALGFDRIFRRMWRFYLAYSEAGFASGYLDLHQLVLQPKARS